MSDFPDYRDHYGQWALVVGGSEGLGEALARGLARRRMNVALVARNAEKLEAAASRIATYHGVETLAIPADLAQADVLDQILALLAGREIGFLIYNCAAENGGEFLAEGVDSHLENIQVNCVAPTVLTHHFAREMVARKRGGVVLCSSIAGLQGINGGVKMYH
ncbi:SDR family NAD(P)-dependent oxidoreductase [Rhizorhapis sp. SPR117]|uniref:SDR family NAD(P)-dependent oxidoreductase n=1 Tax=Rhizorhapis sp. SPR117 TaxID=2912611 RepID=UPI001F1DAE54|nr:SDR family NAD(P)-dependent oxidoreductase [Rhizorhapis sp. SPR117]